MLLRVPPPEFLESAISWICRAALSQAISVKDLLEYLQISPRQDLDFAFACKSRTKRIARACHLEPESFGPMRHMFRSLQSIDRKATFLLRHGPFPCTRYCPQCFKEQRTPYLALHWRFKAYRWCSDHKQLLRDRCPACSAPVVLPANLILAAENGRRPQLDCCMACGAKLSNKVTDGTRFSGTREFLTAWESRLIRNGSAVLAAMLHRKVLVGTPDYERSLKFLRRLERGGHIPHQPMRYETLERTHVKYRHPWTGALTDAARPARAPAAKPVEQPRSGLFDGYLS